MKPWLIVLLSLTLPLAAQEQKKEQPPANPRAQKLFVLKYADPNQVANLLREFGAGVQPNTEMHALAVAAAENLMPAIEDAIQKLDVPSAQPRDLELTVYYLAGSAVESTDGEPVPKDLDSVVAQLKTAFPYSHYRLMDTLTLRTRSGQTAYATSEGGRVTVGNNTSEPVSNSFRIQSASLSADGTTVRIDKMQVTERLPVATGPTPNFNYHEIRYDADGLDIKEGQKAVVGRLGASQGQALFLVLVAHIIQ